MTNRSRCAALYLLAACFVIEGCTSGKTERSYGVAIHGNPHQGKELIVSFGCGACHIIPGIRGARGLVGPPLILFGDRTMIAGEIPNMPDNLVRWIENPPAIEPKTAMPDLGVSQAQAKDIAAYLYTLR
ncbi:MAG: c-type cytochrome [Candidatus Acidiferrales bacterium]